MRKNFKFITLMLALTLGLVTAAFGQRTTGDIEGTITDPTGAVVPNVSVTVASTGDSGFKRTVQANADGFFRVQQVPPGVYSVSTGAISGFGATERKVSVAVDATAAVNITLAVGGGNTVVDVTGGDSAPIDVGGSKVSTVVAFGAVPWINTPSPDMLPSNTSRASSRLPSVAERPHVRKFGTYCRSRASPSSVCTPRLLPTSSCHSSTTTQRSD